MRTQSHRDVWCYEEVREPAVRTAHSSKRARGVDRKDLKAARFYEREQVERIDEVLGRLPSVVLARDSLRGVDEGCEDEYIVPDKGVG